MAIINRRPGKGLILHSDRGVQYAAAATRDILSAHHMRPSMSRKGNPWDNAVAESFFATLEKELLYASLFGTKREARTEIFQLH